MHLERAAAARQSWSVHVEALGGEHLRGGRVHVVEEHALDAALEQADGGTPLALCLGVLRQAPHRVAQRRAGRERGERAGARQRAAAARQPVHPERAAERHKRRKRAQSTRVGEQLE